MFFLTPDVECGMPEDIKNGRYSLATNVTYYGAALHYECDENYQLEGHARRLCLENGTWSSETPFCKGNITACYEFSLNPLNFLNFTFK